MYIFGGYNGSVVLNDFYELKFEAVVIPRSTLLDDLRNMIDSPILSDVTFLVENKEVKASKLLLASRSDHFRALFFGGLKETNN